MTTPPAHLSTESKALWRELHERYGFEEHERKTLRLALEALDRCSQARRALRKHGLTYEDRFGQPHARPEVAIERDGRAAFARLMAQLELPGEEPPHTYGRPERDRSNGRYRPRRRRDALA